MQPWILASERINWRGVSVQPLLVQVLGKTESKADDFWLVRSTQRSIISTLWCSITVNSPSLPPITGREIFTSLGRGKLSITSIRKK